MKHPDPGELELADIMFALSDPARLAIVRALSVEARPMTCQELSAPRPKSTMSRHFKVLREAGIIRTEVEGKEHLNTLRLDDLERAFPGLLTSVVKSLGR